MKYEAVICDYTNAPEGLKEQIAKSFGQVMYTEYNINKLYKSIEAFNNTGPWKVEFKESNVI